LKRKRFQEIDWYETPGYYDIVFDTETTTQAAFLERVRTKYVRSRGKRVLEPACGSGRLVAALASHGYEVCGFDMSRAMLAYARERLRHQGLEAILKRMDFADFSFGRRRFDLAYCLVGSFQHMPTECAARRHLSLVADALRPGGVYVLGLHLSDYSDQGHMERWDVQRDNVHVICNIRTWPANRKRRTALMRARLTVRDLGQFHQLQSTWVARTYGPRQFRALLSGEDRFELLCCHSFEYDIGEVLSLEGDRLDIVAILRRRPDNGCES